MKKALMATVAIAAVVGFTGIAAAQNTQGPSGGGAMKSEGAQQEQKSSTGTPGASGGAMMHQQNGAQSTEKSANPSTGKAAEGKEQGAKPDQRMGQSQKNEAAPQRGAQDERGTQQKGAASEHSTPQKGAQEEGGKSGTNDTTQHASQGKPGGSGASVQLSQDQRSRIGAIIGKNSSARVSTNVNFDVTVGAKVPSSVHIVVVPQDVVEIVPQYEGFDYVVVGEQILIIDPDSMEIVAVITA
jgi:Protein of unknown function (DUF1236)